VARHPEDVGRTVEDFKWIMRVIVRPARLGSGMPIMKGYPRQKSTPSSLLKDDLND
jgi:hypothetical protein